MKKLLKEFISTTLIFTFLFLITLNFEGCANYGLIPNGKYVLANYQDKDVFTLKTSETNDEFYWEIDGDFAQRCISGVIDYKCKIIEDNGVLYFKGYTWSEIFSTKKLGSTTQYVVEYDDKSKSITLLVVDEIK